jgi:hypothetical protein
VLPVRLLLGHAARLDAWLAVQAGRIGERVLMSSDTCDAISVSAKLT